MNIKPTKFFWDDPIKSPFWIWTPPWFSPLDAGTLTWTHQINFKKNYYLRDLRYPVPRRSKKEGAVGCIIYDFNELLFWDQTLQLTITITRLDLVWFQLTAAAADCRAGSVSLSYPAITKPNTSRWEFKTSIYISSGTFDLWQTFWSFLVDKNT